MGCILGKRPAAGDGNVHAGDSSHAADRPSLVPDRPWIPSSPKDPVVWPAWLSAAAGDSLRGWSPRRADSFQKLAKIGSGTYSNVYKAKDLETGRMVALKKVRFEAVEPESVRFMVREIAVLRRLDHPNVVRLEGIATSRVSAALYLVFEYMEHDLAGLASAPGVRFTEPQLKCYMKQLLSGLEHCHSRGVLHRDIKCSNLLLDNEGILKIADFGLACTFDPNHRKPMTSRVVTLWYRAPELVLGATYYGAGVDLWSAGCILAELLAGKPILTGRTEVEQLHKIFKLCGSPSEKYWKKSKLPHATIVKPQQHYKRCIAETFKDFPAPALSLIETLLAIDPEKRGTATAALNGEFFTTKPYACEPSSLPQYPPSKEMDAKLRDEKARRQRRVDGKRLSDTTGRARIHPRQSRAVPAPEANAELQVNLHRWRRMTSVKVTSKSEKFPPPHQDGAVGFPLDDSRNATSSFVVADASFASSIFEARENSHGALSGKSGNSIARSKSGSKGKPQLPPSLPLMRSLTSSSIGQLMDLRRNTRVHGRTKGKELEGFGAGS